MTLRQKLFLAFLFVVIIPILLLGMIIIELMITQSDGNIAHIVAHQLVLARANYQRQGEELENSMTLVGSDPHIQQTILQKEYVTLQHYLRIWQGNYPQTDLWLIANEQGEIVTQFDAMFPSAYATSPLQHLVQHTLTTNQPVRSTELLTGPDPPQQHLVQAVLVPVGAGQGPIGVIMAIDRLANNVHASSSVVGLPYGEASGDTSSLAPLIFITQQDEIVASSLPRPNYAEMITPDIQEAIELTLSNNWGFTGQGETLGKAYQLASEPILDSNNKVIGTFFAGLPYKKYFGLQAQIGWIVTTMLLLSGIISLITASLIASAIAQPIRGLIKKSGQLAGGNLSVRASVSGQDEVAQLGHAFNKMAAKLETSYEAVEQERQRALAIIEASADGIWVVSKYPDGKRRISIANSALEHMTGRSRPELIGKQCSGLMGVCTLEGEPICATSCPFTQPHQQTGIVHGLLPDAGGNETPVEISYGRLTNQRGELTGLVHIMRDLTLRREVEKLKADFISMVSHELRTPLGHIKGFASTLLQTDVTWDAETQRDFLSSIDHEADRLTKLVENLLQMSRIEAGGLERIKHHRHRVDELLEMALPELQQRSGQHNLVIHIPPAPAYKSTSILADARGIELVLLNLVENAVKYSPPHTDIVLWLGNSDEEITFHVRDEGPGIVPGDQPHIFDRFYRARGTRRGVSGTGLGLAICKRIVEAHGGRIWVNNHPQQGACFSFSLPVEPVKEADYA